MYFYWILTLMEAVPVMDDAVIVYVPGLIFLGTCQLVLYSPLFVDDVGRVSIIVLLLPILIDTDAVVPASVPEIIMYSPRVYVYESLFS